MNAVGFAWRSLVRPPARASLGIRGVAAVGALLFDMLLLSNGLVVSMRDLFAGAGFDIRVTASESLPGTGPLIEDAEDATRRIAALPSVESVVALRVADATLSRPGERSRFAAFQGAGGGPERPWSILRGRHPETAREIVINENTVQRMPADVADEIVVRASCVAGVTAMPPVPFTVVGVADFPFDSPNNTTVGVTMEAMHQACGDDRPNRADVLLVTSAPGAVPDAAAAEIAALRSDLYALTNEAALGLLQRGSFSYFNQISTVLVTVTLTFAVLLITVLLTVSANQRLGEVAALRALGFSRRRVVADVLSESALIVGIGGGLSLPLGALLALWLDRILKQMPGVPADVHFFVYQPEAFTTHALLLMATAVVAALYPMYLVAGLPIATTLRNEVGA
jgi:ABC-type lipoprotein release transport system permease subunit